MMGALLKSARKKAGLSQQKLAEQAGMRQCQVSDLEGDKLSLDHVHWGTIRRLCRALHISPDDLMDLESVREYAVPVA